jgi:endonuclease-3 related protein
MRLQETPLKNKAQSIRTIYLTLYQSFGPQNWWPAESVDEMILGAFLTQNTAWSNVEKALQNLRDRDLLTLEKARQISLDDYANLIRSAGFFRQKALRIKDFAAWIHDEFAGDARTLFARFSDAKLVRKLLERKGIGEETAYSIAHYAAQREFFVVDAYARRVFERHQIFDSKDSYVTIRETVEAAFPADFATVFDAKLAPSKRPEIHPPSAMSTHQRSNKAQLLNDFHALIVQTGKHYCRRSRPACEACPLRKMSPKSSGAALL